MPANPDSNATWNKAANWFLISIGSFTLFVFVLVVWVAVKTKNSPVSTRGGVTIAVSNAHSASIVLNRFYKENGFFPPRPDGRSYYGPYYRSLVGNIPTGYEVNTDGYQGQPLDPYRKTSTFRDDGILSGRYSGKGSSIFSSKVTGYPLRYYRSADAQSALIIANGPDRDSDLNRKELDEITSGTKPNLLKALSPFRYDSTNGTRSSDFVASGDMDFELWGND